MRFYIVRQSNVILLQPYKIWTFSLINKEVTEILKKVHDFFRHHVCAGPSTELGPSDFSVRRATDCATPPGYHYIYKHSFQGFVKSLKQINASIVWYIFAQNLFSGLREIATFIYWAITIVHLQNFTKFHVSYDCSDQIWPKFKFFFSLSYFAIIKMTAVIDGPFSAILKEFLEKIILKYC